jgi:hypothetical protein
MQQPGNSSVLWKLCTIDLTNTLLFQIRYSTEILIIQTSTRNDELHSTILRKRFPGIRSVALVHAYAEVAQPG